MAINIHTDTRFEKCLQWLVRRSGKTKTEVVKELIYEKYRLRKTAFRFGAVKGLNHLSPEEIQAGLKEIDQDDDMD